MNSANKLTPCLWFNFNAEEAVNHYLSIFKNARILHLSRYPDSIPEHAGKVLIMGFEIEGNQFQALNGGPQFAFTEAISISVNCEDQAEVDYLWEKLSEGGSTSRCGWLKDKFGLSWQIVPSALFRLMSSPDTVKAARVTQAMLAMTKIDIALLQEAHDRP